MPLLQEKVRGGKAQEVAPLDRLRPVGARGPGGEAAPKKEEFEDRHPKDNEFNREEGKP